MLQLITLLPSFYRIWPKFEGLVKECIIVGMSWLWRWQFFVPRASHRCDYLDKRKHNSLPHQHALWHLTNLVVIVLWKLSLFCCIETMLQLLYAFFSNKPKKYLEFTKLAKYAWNQKVKYYSWMWKHVGLTCPTL